MSITAFNEAVVEDAALETLRELGYATMTGEEIGPDGTNERTFRDVVLKGRLESAVAQLNPSIPAAARDDAIRQLLSVRSQVLVAENHRIHLVLTQGIPVQFRLPDGSTRGDIIRLLDFDRPERNDFLAVNQLTVKDRAVNRRPDIVVFVNGLPLANIELKNPADKNATLAGAWNQIQTYQTEIPDLFRSNVVSVVSDGREARVGTLTANWERFMPWRATTADEEPLARGKQEQDTLLRGIFRPEHVLDLIRYFVLFEDRDGAVSKKVAGYHQFFAVRKAVDRTIAATSQSGDRKVGVVWHTQGSGKSLSMVFYAGRIIQREEMQNPTLVIITDRNDLDDQLFGQFAAARDLLRGDPIQADSRDELRQMLNRASGGVIFTTVQKFAPPEKGERMPMLSDRRNIVVIADEAHRSQYDFIDGFAAHLRQALPNASYLGFTGTPIEDADRSTRAVFGDYIDTYDIPQAVDDGATVRIYYEARLAKVGLDEASRATLDSDFADLTEAQEESERERTKGKWAQLEAVVGADQRLRQVAADIVDHFEGRLSAFDGKGMIVAMSRRIAAQLYAEIVALRPEWHSDDDDKGFIKVVMTGSATDPALMQPHLRNKQRRDAIARRYKDPADPLRLVIVRDMWLTGFDVPSMHTMYIDKPMKGHGLMQAIARVNRVFRGKDGGLVVDYLGIAESLKRALAVYTQRSRGEVGIPQEEAVAVLIEKVETVERMFHGFDYAEFFTAGANRKLDILADAQNHILGLEDGRERFREAVTQVGKAFRLAAPHEDALKLAAEVGFFQTVRGNLIKNTVARDQQEHDIEFAVGQLVSRSVIADGVVDIFGAAGLARPELSILSDEFLAEMRELPQKNLALETLKKLLNDEIRLREQRNVVESRQFSEMLDRALLGYQNRSIEAAEVINELIELAKKMQQANRRGEELGLRDDELAFYDALLARKDPAGVLDEASLKPIAQELVRLIRQNASIDWTERETAQAKLRAMVRRTLRRLHFPEETREAIVVDIMTQAKLFSDEWAA